MGRRQVVVIVVRKPVTLALLAITTAAMVALIYALAGRAYVRESHSWSDVAEALVQRGGSTSTGGAVVALMPLVANALIFVPWGFLAFMAIDSPSWSRARSYALTVVAGACFALAVDLWQRYLPTSVITHTDVVANVVGTFAGAVVGHLRKQVRLRFDY
jgi:VanZ family protein